MLAGRVCDAPQLFFPSPISSATLNLNFAFVGHVRSEARGVQLDALFTTMLVIKVPCKANSEMFN